jgi:hypothetical protein
MANVGCLNQNKTETAEVAKIAKLTIETSDKLRLNLEKFVLVESRKIAKEKSENSDALCERSYEPLKDGC